MNISLILTDLLITCAPVSLSRLQGKYISAAYQMLEPPPTSPTPPPKTFFLVSYSDAVCWSLPVEDCQTWFVGVAVVLVDLLFLRNQAFKSHFTEFGLRKFHILYKGTPLVSEEWPMILQSAKDSNIELEFKLR